jgi:cytochrome c5
MAESAMGAAADMAESVMPGAAAPAGDTAKGKAVYDSACFACHMTGAAGAPKLGDKSLWGPRIAQGMDVLYNTALNGKGAMPPKGGRMDLSDADVKAAVDYMVEQAR